LFSYEGISTIAEPQQQQKRQQQLNVKNSRDADKRRDATTVEASIEQKGFQQQYSTPSTAETPTICRNIEEKRFPFRLISL
jgi:hypothetical protein